VSRMAVTGPLWNFLENVQRHSFFLTCCKPTVTVDLCTFTARQVCALCVDVNNNNNIYVVADWSFQQ